MLQEMKKLELLKAFADNFYRKDEKVFLKNDAPQWQRECINEIQGECPYNFNPSISGPIEYIVSFLTKVKEEESIENIWIDPNICYANVNQKLFKLLESDDYKSFVIKEYGDVNTFVKVILDSQSLAIKHIKNIIFSWVERISNERNEK